MLVAAPFISLLFIPALQQASGAIVQKQVAGPPVQKTSGWCSPVIANVVGNVTVNCIGVDPRALSRLNTELSHMNLQRADKIREADQWVSKYKELETQLSKAGDDAVLSRQAEEYLHEGELEKAGAILDRVLAAEDKGTDHTAANHYNRALDYELLFNLPEALPHLKKAYQLATVNETAPEEVKYGREYAYVLLRENGFGVAEPVLLAILGVARELAKANPTEYQPPLAAILNNLGVLYLYAHRTKDGEAIFNEVLTTYRELVKKDPASYQLELAGALNNLGLLYEEDRKYTEAVAAYKEALGIDVALANADPATYKPYLADTLTDIGNLYGDINRLQDAEDAYQEALDIRRELAKTNPTVYQPTVALTLNNLGMIYTDMKRPKEAEAADQEALSTYRQVAKSNPGAYQPAVATALYNLGRLYNDTSQVKESEAAYQEALDIFRKLAADNPAAYEPDVAHTLYFLALVHFALDNIPQATKESNECVTTNRERWKVNPEAAADDLANCLVLALVTEPELSRQCQLAREAVSVAQSPKVKDVAASSKTMLGCPAQ
jgi:tetratricopeptide (TPR) repeat protein